MRSAFSSYRSNLVSGFDLQLSTCVLAGTGRRVLLPVIASAAVMLSGCPGAGSGGPDVWSYGDTVVLAQQSCEPCPPKSYDPDGRCLLFTPGWKLPSDCSACLINSKREVGICATCSKGTLVLDPKEPESVEQAIGTQSGTALLSLVAGPGPQGKGDAAWEAESVRLRWIASELSVTSTVDVSIPGLSSFGGPGSVGPRGVAACGEGVVALVSWSSQGLFVALVKQDGILASSTVELAAYVHDIYASPDEGEGFLVLTSETANGGELFVTKIGCDLLPEWSQNEPLCEGCTRFKLPEAWKICGREEGGTILAGTREEFDSKSNRLRHFAVAAFMTEHTMHGSEVAFDYLPKWKWPQAESFVAGCWFAGGEGHLISRICDADKPDRCWPFTSTLTYYPGSWDEEWCEMWPGECQGGVWVDGQVVLESKEPFSIGAVSPLPDGSKAALAGFGAEGLSLEVLEVPGSGWPETRYIEDLVPFKPGKCTRPVMAKATSDGGNYFIGLGCGGDYPLPLRDRVLVTQVMADCIDGDDQE